MDPFAVLRGGLRFDKEKNKKVHTIFESDPAGEADHGDSLVVKASGRRQRRGRGRKARRKHEDTGSSDEDEDEGEEQQEQEDGKEADSSSSSSSSDGDSDGSDGEEEEEEEGGDEGEQDNVAETAKLGDKRLRKQFEINVRGDDVPRPIVAFHQLAEYDAPPKLVETLSDLHPQPTPIQMQGIPALLKRRDVVGIAPTGSGKTCAFAFPLLAALKEHKRAGLRALVVAPTPELAHQIKTEFDVLNTRLKLSVQLLTRSNVGNVARSRAKTHDILVSTPKRLEHFLGRELIDLSTVEWVVIDEADTLFENGYETQLDAILHACTNRKHVSLFSATMPERVENLARTVLQNHIRITVGRKNAAATTVDQRLTFTGDEVGKMHALRNLVRGGITPPVLIFVQSKARAKHLFHELVYDNLNVDVIHADRTGQQRADIVRGFREGQIWFLICTDLMGRGIDFKGVNLVINFDFPPSANEYIHRIGRTGRAGRTGTAITFFTTRDAPTLRSIATVMHASGCKVPEWIFKIRGLRKGQRSRTVTRETISSRATVMQTDKAKRKAWAEKNKKNRAKAKRAKKAKGKATVSLKE